MVRARRFSIFLFLLLVGTFSFVSCQDDEEHLSPEPYQVLHSILSTHEIIFNDAVQALVDEVGLTEEEIEPYRQRVNMASLRTRKYTAHVITYHTTDPNGNPVIASGVVYYPKSGTPRGVIEAVSFNKNKFQCPSKELANIQVLQGMAGYIVLVPDQIGCGATESMVIPYLYYDNVAKISADFRLAATELVRNEYGRSMPSWTLISGISLAASEAWALARYYHFHPELGVQVDQVWMSGGAYNPGAVLDEQLKTLSTDYAFIPNAVYSINHYDNLGLNLREVFRGELSEHYEDWCTGDVALFDLTDRLGTDMSQYLNLDFFNDANPDYQRLRARVDRFAIPNDWIPECTIHIYHGRNDTFVPISNSEALVDYLRSVGAKVDYVVTESGHVDNCIAMASDLVELLY